MDYKEFTSQDGWFSLILPSEWEEYEDGEEDTYAFFNAKSWTGNLRVTPFRRTQLANPNEDKASQYISEELKQNEGATKIKLGDFNCVHYKKEVLQDGDELVIYYWATGKRDNIFICSFAIDKKQELTKRNKTELKIVQDIIKSIKII